MPSLSEARARLCDPAAEVSAHWLLSEDGTTEALVDEAMRAWHAGAGGWGGAGDVNSRSIGIEIANPGDAPFPHRQFAALERLLADIMGRWQIPPAGVIAHSDMAPGRKADPGPRFDWERLERQGLARARGRDGCPADASPEAFRQVARAAGYTTDADDETLLAAVRLRYRPWGRGPLTGADFTPLGATAHWT
jgi:N-acetylmuramoyl-L-alanine amidase